MNPSEKAGDYPSENIAGDEETSYGSADYAGDIFVVGQNKDGVGSPLLFTDTELTLGGGKGTLTVDGNKDNIIVTVVGSALFVTESSKVNLYDGIVISNNKKLGNSRTDTCEGFANIDILSRAGGAAIMLINGSVNMYGGIIENNIVMTEATVIVGDDGTETRIELGAFGGAIYNRANFNMYGGIIRNSESLRGGAIYNDEIVYLVGGIIANNKSHTYGGAVSSSSSAEAQMFIGSAEKVGDGMLFEGNLSLSAGGALYSNTNSPIVIYGNTVFSGNSAENSSGGAIYTGGALTVRGATFIGNFCCQNRVVTFPGLGAFAVGRNRFERSQFDRIGSNT
jgi:predicted outer membrane repeat protein